MDPSSLLWSKQLRRDYSSPTKHTINSLQRNYHFNQYQNRNTLQMNSNRKYQRPPRMSELAREVRHLKQEAMEKVNLEAESQKTFECMQNDINLLRRCFESFTSMIVDECEDLREDHLKSAQDLNQFENKFNKSTKHIHDSLKSMEASFKAIVDNLASNTTNNLINLQQQIDELRNIISVQHQQNERKNMLKQLGLDNNINDNCNHHNPQIHTNECDQSTNHISTSSHPSQFKKQFISTAPSAVYPTAHSHTQNLKNPSIVANVQTHQDAAITTLTSTVAEQQTVIDELKRKLKHIDKTINMNVTK